MLEFIKILFFPHLYWDSHIAFVFWLNSMISFNKGSIVELAVKLQNKDYYTKRQKKILGMRQSSEAY